VTLVVGLRGADGIVLASDSQATYGEVKQSQPKLFHMSYGVIWGSAGPYGATQDLYATLEVADLRPNPGREEAKTVLGDAWKATVEELRGREDAQPFEALFAWHDSEDRRHYLLRGLRRGHVEFDPVYGAIGSAENLGRFGFIRNEFLPLPKLPLERTRLIVYMVAEEAVKASSKGVGLPIQLAFVSRGEAGVLRREEVEGTSNAVGLLRERQRELLMPDGGSIEGTPKGIRPRGR
jgi:ATP-dependent protease HslVU (ClpYQ) peptidase subunit